jgi:hypothetical protein
MLAGQYVDHDSHTWQVLSISGTTPGYPGGPSRTTYGLVRVGDRDLRYVDNPTAGDLRLTPACPQCERPPGYGACKALGECQGPLPVAQPRTPRPRERGDNDCHCGACPECWTALHGKRVRSA